MNANTFLAHETSNLKCTAIREKSLVSIQKVGVVCIEIRTSYNHSVCLYAAITCLFVIGKYKGESTILDMPQF